MDKQFESNFIIIIFSTQPTTAIRSWEVSMTSGFLITRTSWWSSTSAITTSAGCQPTYPGSYRLSRRSTPHVTRSAPSEWILSVPSSVKGQLILIISLLMMFGLQQCLLVNLKSVEICIQLKMCVCLYYTWSTSNEFGFVVKLWRL